MILSDDKLATVGTINFDYRSFYHNYECGVWLYNTDSILDIKEDFLNTIDESLEITLQYVEEKIGFFKLFIGEIIKVFAPLF